MKREDVTYIDKLNELRLDVSHPKSSGINFILLEGDTDIRLFRKFFNLDYCKVENIPGGNAKLEECVETLNINYPLIIGIRDSDFLKVNNPGYNKNNMFLTDLHDIELMIIHNENILNALVFEFSSVRQYDHIKLKKKIVNLISDMSYLKLLNDKYNLELCFKSGFQDLINFHIENFDFSQFLMRIISKSPKAKIREIALIIEEINTLKASNYDLLQITNGHDLLKSFAVYFRTIHGKSGINEDILASSIRMAYSFDFFKNTILYSNLVTWETNNNTKIFIN